MGNISGALAGKHVLLTGVTGFVGEALLQLLLAELPEVRLTLLIRPQGTTGGLARARAAWASASRLISSSDRFDPRARTSIAWR